ncbi:NAD(P)-dependent oxidoreductase [Alisedimentitalea sp. MJ-SS2]|uniref:L-threonate dehydrogenase n=1 Tax=Aliisedimentitalea sp. MJ-SS2 TaxID=3049795 RepID=UPI00290C4877|nr:L-threonate dehydrogenase [Alisedimentitalea sp. MJ-SS2]MDU8927071.1 NAD(P)-dependent oxidoreductase [Alisedimentitalea sp. MJ-SS2]
MTRTDAKNILVVGLGSMGFGMAESLLSAGHNVFGADIDAEKVQTLCAKGAQSADQLGKSEADVLVSVVLNAEQTETVLFGTPDLAARVAKGGVVLSCATVAPSFAQEMAARATARGLHYLDAPISGGAVRAAAGQLSVMASGSDAAFAAASPALDAMAETVHRLGDTAGAGSAMKAVNQLLAGVHIAAMGEALAFGMTQGLDIGRMIDVISVSAGTSWMFENRAPHVRDADYTPRSTISIWPKDLGIVSEIAQSAGLDVPITRTALERYREAAGSGLGLEDDAAIIKPYAASVGLKLPGEE